MKETKILLLLDRVDRRLLLPLSSTQNISGWERPPGNANTLEGREQIIFKRLFFTSRVMTSVWKSTNRFVVRIDNAHRVHLS